jgi:ectoine hydroxylase-related dioxygenase (phytanoyl-CoA dioxygenase family)
MTLNNKHTNFFLKNGYCKIKLFNKKEIEQLLTVVNKKITKLCPEIKSLKNSDLKFFHKNYDNEKIRKKILNPSTRYININKKKFLSNIAKKKILALMNKFWGHKKNSIFWVGSPKKKQIKLNAAGFRLVRPEKKQDGGTEHIDAYSKDIKAFFTLWIPLIGFDEKYTLKIAPKSHLLNHELKTYKNTKKYISRGFKDKYVKKFNFIRPKLKMGQVLIHHPNLIHGGNVNLGKCTRISIEVRFFDKKKFNINKSFDNSLVN